MHFRAPRELILPHCVYEALFHLAGFLRECRGGEFPKKLLISSSEVTQIVKPQMGRDVGDLDAAWFSSAKDKKSLVQPTPSQVGQRCYIQVFAERQLQNTLTHAGSHNCYSQVGFAQPSQRSPAIATSRFDTPAHRPADQRVPGTCRSGREPGWVALCQAHGQPAYDGGRGIASLPAVPGQGVAKGGLAVSAMPNGYFRQAV